MLGSDSDDLAIGTRAQSVRIAETGSQCLIALSVGRNPVRAARTSNSARVMEGFGAGMAGNSVSSRMELECAQLRCLGQAVGSTPVWSDSHMRRMQAPSAPGHNTQTRIESSMRLQRTARSRCRSERHSSRSASAAVESTSDSTDSAWVRALRTRSGRAAVIADRPRSPGPGGSPSGRSRGTGRCQPST